MLVAVAGGQELQAVGGVLGADVAPQGYAVPGRGGQLEQRGGRAGEVPVEPTGELVTVEAGVVPGGVVVPDQRRPADREEPPRPWMGEARDRFVAGLRPRGVEA